MSKSKAKISFDPRAEFAAGLADVLDSRFLNALAESTRVELLKLLATRGKMDVATISSLVPQDRSVVSRHLNIMYESGILVRDKVERSVYYSVDGMSCVNKFREITDCMEELVRICCPPAPEQDQSQGKDQRKSNKQKSN